MAWSLLACNDSAHASRVVRVSGRTGWSVATDAGASERAVAATVLTLSRVVGVQSNDRNLWDGPTTQLYQNQR